jgi:hypothetical protein
MKSVIGSLAISFIFALGGCQSVQTAKSDGAQETLPSDDSSEVLIRHLLRRSREADSEVIRLEDEVAKHDNKCLNEEIAILEGRTVEPKDRVKAEDHSAAVKALNNDLSRMAQGMLDAEEVIELHNRKHPESPWADLKEDLRESCGDCTKERAIRDLQLKEEAQQGVHTDSKK